MNVSSRSLRRRQLFSAAPGDGGGEDADATAAAAAARGGGPLAGVVACLSGQTRDAKDRLHRTIARLGGTAVGDFDPATVTHRESSPAELSASVSLCACVPSARLTRARAAHASAFRSPFRGPRPAATQSSSTRRRVPSTPSGGRAAATSTPGSRGWRS